MIGNPPHRLLASGVSPNLEALVRQSIHPHAEIIRIQPTGFEEFGRWIVSLSPLLLSAAFLFGYLEFKTPGFGIFGILSATCALFFFFGHYVAGLSGYENLLLLILGIALILTEFFLFPGTLLPGFLGLGVVLFAALNAMVDRYPSDPFLPTLPQLHLPAINLALGFFGGLLAIILAARYLPETALFRSFRLSATSPTASIALPDSLTINARGKATTDLHPSGTALFGRNSIDVLTEGQFIPKGANIEIHRIEGGSVFVRRVSLS
jgi:membrane-bound serine protease (ClpP class)